MRSTDDKDVDNQSFIKAMLSKVRLYIKIFDFVTMTLHSIIIRPLLFIFFDLLS